MNNNKNCIIKYTTAQWQENNFDLFNITFSTIDYNLMLDGEYIYVNQIDHQNQVIHNIQIIQINQ